MYTAPAPACILCLRRTYASISDLNDRIDRVVQSINVQYFDMTRRQGTILNQAPGIQGHSRTQQSDGTRLESTDGCFISLQSIETFSRKWSVSVSCSQYQKEDGFWGAQRRSCFVLRYCSCFFCGCNGQPFPSKRCRWLSWCWNHVEDSVLVCAPS